MTKAFNVGGRVAYHSWAGWRWGIVERWILQLRQDDDGNETQHLVLGLREEAPLRPRAGLVWRDCRQCCAMIAGEHVRRESA